MNDDLSDLMHDATDGAPPSRGLDPGDLLSRGRTRVRRRRALAVGATAAGVAAIVVGGAALGGSVGTGGDGGSDDPAPFATASAPSTDGATAAAGLPEPVDPVPATATYDPSPVSGADLAERCAIVLSNMTGSKEGVPVPPTGPSYTVGDLAVVGAGDDPDDIADHHGECRVPQAGMPKAGTSVADVPAVEDVAGIREACGTSAGFDLTGWRLLVAADGAGSGRRAVFGSADDHHVLCDIRHGQPVDWAVDQGLAWQLDPTDGPYALTGDAVTAVAQGFHAEATGVFPADTDPVPVRIEVQTGDGRSFDFPVVDRAYSWFTPDLVIDGRMPAVTTRVIAEDGSVLATSTQRGSDVPMASAIGSF